MNKILKYMSFSLFLLNNKNHSSQKEFNELEHNQKLKESLINTFKQKPELSKFFEENFSDPTSTHPTSIVYLQIKEEIRIANNMSVFEYFKNYKDNKILSKEMEKLKISKKK